MRLHSHWIDNSRAQDALHHHGMVFLLEDLDDRFDERVREWFDAVGGLGRVIDHYFSTINSEFTFLETRFMNYVQAIEGYHRRRLDHPAMDETLFAELCDAIIAPLTGKRRKLAKKALKHANEPSLEVRIKDVAEGLGPAGHAITGAGRVTIQAFAHRAAQIRNTYAHNLTAQMPDIYELALYTEQLKTLMESLLLSELGFDETRVHQLLVNARRIQLLRQISLDTRERAGPSDS